MCNQCRKDSEQVADIELLPDLHIQFLTHMRASNFFSSASSLLYLHPSLVTKMNSVSEINKWSELLPEVIRSDKFMCNILSLFVHCSAHLRFIHLLDHHGCRRQTHPRMHCAWTFIWLACLQMWVEPSIIGGWYTHFNSRATNLYQWFTLTGNICWLYRN